MRDTWTDRPIFSVGRSDPKKSVTLALLIFINENHSKYSFLTRQSTKNHSKYSLFYEKSWRKSWGVVPNFYDSNTSYSYTTPCKKKHFYGSNTIPKNRRTESNLCLIPTPLFSGSSDESQEGTSNPPSFSSCS